MEYLGLLVLGGIVLEAPTPLPTPTNGLSLGEPGDPGDNGLTVSAIRTLGFDTSLSLLIGIHVVLMQRD